MHILVIHETEYRDKMVYEWQVVPEVLSSRGHQVYVIEYPAIWKRHGLTDLLQLKPKIFHHVRRAAKAKGITLIQPGFIKIPILSRLSAWFYYWGLIPWVIKKYQIEKILLYGVATNGLQTIVWSKLLHLPIHFRCLDVSHEIVPHPLLKYPAYLMEALVYRHVDEITAISPGMEKYAKKLTGRTSKITYLPAGADTDLFYPQPKKLKLMTQWGIKTTDYVLIFAGTLYNFSGLDLVIQQFPQWLKKNPQLKLLIVGRGEQELLLKDQVKKLHLTHAIIFTGFIQYEKLPSYINLAEVGINPFISNPITDRIFPGKMYQYVACGKPAISSRLPGVLDIFPDTTTSHGLYYYKDMADFFKLVEKLRHVRVIHDPNPSLQDIAVKIEAHLRSL